MIKRINEIVKENSRKIIEDDLYVPMILVSILSILSVCSMMYYAGLKIIDNLEFTAGDQKDNEEV